MGVTIIHMPTRKHLKYIITYLFEGLICENICNCLNNPNTLFNIYQSYKPDPRTGGPTVLLRGKLGILGQGHCGSDWTRLRAGYKECVLLYLFQTNLEWNRMLKEV